MEPSSQFRSRKRARDWQEHEEPYDSRKNEEKQQRDCFPGSKRARHDVSNSLDHDSASQSSSHPPPGPCPIATGHSYGPSDVHGNGRLQNGDAYYTAGPSSQIWGPSVLNGEMRVHLSNVFHTYNHGFHNPNTKEAQEQVLKCLLYYSTMDDRKAQLRVVDPASFKWVWSRTTFPKWLASDDGGLFWISGKPASGKSTLIHYLSGDSDGPSEVARFLGRSGKNCLLVRFFFDFRAGTGIANTTLGMLRSLLSQLIEKSTDIKDFILKRCQHRLQGNWPELEAELLDLFCEAIEVTKVSICGLVDGLDEYAGSLWKLADLILRIQKRIKIKICLASRPETELLHRLRGVPTFAMQDYNQETIEAYIESAIVDISHFVPVTELRTILQKEVRAYANGVILWAAFVVDEAVKAALHGCTSNEIRQRIRSFPQELSSVYRRIWDKLTPRDQLFAATTIFVIQNWYPSLSNLDMEVPLSSHHLTVCCRTIIRRLDPSFEVDANYSELHYRLKTYATLGGLVEFVGSKNTAILAHKTIESFLEQLPEYAQQTDRIRQVVDVEYLAPTLLADTVLRVCDALIPELDYPESLLLEITRDPNVQPLKLLSDHWHNLRRRKPLDCARETIECAWPCVAGLHQFSSLKQARHAELVASVSQSWLMQYYGIPYYFEFLTSISGQTWINSIRPIYSHPELFYLANSGFDHVVRFIAQNAGILASPGGKPSMYIHLLRWLKPSVFKRLYLSWKAHREPLGRNALVRTGIVPRQTSRVMGDTLEPI